MSGDYKYNPPNLGMPPISHYYLVLFLQKKNVNQLGQAIVYYRKTLDMLEDLVNEIDQTYIHCDDIGDQAYLVDQTFRDDIDVYFKVIYTNKLNQVINLIDQSKFKVTFSWHQIPNMNPPNDRYNR